MQHSRWEFIRDFIGVELSPVTHKERLVSGLGAFLGILFTFMVSSLFLDGVGTLCVVSSMGASAVLLFGVPHGALSQPWPVVGGHLISAVIGVACAKIIPGMVLAGAIAVALAMIFMHYGRCIHPPGGATAITAVIGGNQVHSLGWKYLVTPIGLNVAVILLIAFAFNGFFKWRRYPAVLGARKRRVDVVPRESLTYALRQMDSFIDVSEEDLEEIYSLAEKHAKGKAAQAAALKLAKAAAKRPLERAAK